jgi:hypothetical protein
VVCPILDFHSDLFSQTFLSSSCVSPTPTDEFRHSFEDAHRAFNDDVIALRSADTSLQAFSVCKMWHPTFCRFGSPLGYDSKRLFRCVCSLTWLSPFLVSFHLFAEIVRSGKKLYQEDWKISGLFKRDFLLDSDFLVQDVLSHEVDLFFFFCFWNHFEISSFSSSSSSSSFRTK